MRSGELRPVLRPRSHPRVLRHNTGTIVIAALTEPKAGQDALGQLKLLVIPRVFNGALRSLSFGAAASPRADRRVLVAPDHQGRCRHRAVVAAAPERLLAPAVDCGPHTTFRQDRREAHLAPQLRPSCGGTPRGLRLGSPRRPTPLQLIAERCADSMATALTSRTGRTRRRRQGVRSRAENRLRAREGALRRSMCSRSPRHASG
jgi:hypothetical protein